MTEHEIAERLRREGLDPAPWSNGPGDRYATHEHAYAKVIVCIRGSIRFGLPDEAGSVELTIGDRLELPAGTRHDAVVGADGVSCLEAHREGGAVPARRVLAAGRW